MEKNSRKLIADLLNKTLVVEEIKIDLQNYLKENDNVRWVHVYYGMH